MGEDGRTGYERLRGKQFKGEWVEFGECVWFLPPKSRGVYKLDSRWDTGVWFGFRDESNEALIGTPKGMVRVRPVRRKRSHEQRWDSKVFNEMQGVPWNPEPGRDSSEVKANLLIPRTMEGERQQAKEDSPGDASSNEKEVNDSNNETTVDVTGPSRTEATVEGYHGEVPGSSASSRRAYPFGVAYRRRGHGQGGAHGRRRAER